MEEPVGDTTALPEVCLLVLTRLLGDTWLNALLILVVLVTVLLTIDGRLNRWHRRS